MIMAYGKGELSSIYDIEALLYIQKAQLNKYRQEVTLTTATTNIADTDDNSSLKTTRGGFQQGIGRGNISRVRGRGKARGTYTHRNRPTCQLCGKYGHSVINYWHMYDENFEIVPSRTFHNLLLLNMIRRIKLPS